MILLIILSLTIATLISAAVILKAGYTYYVEYCIHHYTIVNITMYDSYILLEFAEIGLIRAYDFHVYNADTEYSTLVGKTLYVAYDFDIKDCRNLIREVK